ncbi:MAG: hypothetical protein E7050_03930 [Lentisphaerae bacterium]|nr:hypothetical protein [Lentisphaerota bacterium]
MKRDILKYGDNKPAVEVPHFPAPFQTVIWRNWGIVPRENIAAALKCDLKTLDHHAGLLGLVPDDRNTGKFLKRGYLTVIRQNWHLLDYPELLKLLNWTPEKLASVIFEDDQFWFKMGFNKPQVSSPVVTPLSAEQLHRTEEIRELISRLPVPEITDEPFAFLDRRFSGRKAANNTPHLRLAYPYSVSFGVELDENVLSCFPENELDEYAANGVNALFIQGILHTLVPYLGENNPISANWQDKIDNLRKLCDHLATRNIRLFLYFNEPRGLTEKDIASIPESWRGAALPWVGIRSICTGNPEVLQALENGAERLFSLVPALGGVICITRSENPTNCFSHYSPSNPPPCPRCQCNGIVKTITGVLGAIARGVHKANPEAGVYAWNWSWYQPYDEEIIRNLPPDVRLICASEDQLATNVGGIAGMVKDYSISKVGPGPVALRCWEAAKQTGIPVAAKVQLNNSWELSAVPYLPVPGLVEEHLNNLRQLGINDFVLSWSLGGYPGGNMRLLDNSKEEIAREDFGSAAGKILEAYEKFEAGFRHFPFHLNDPLYRAPHNFGPGSLLFGKPTGYEATMVGFPYDDLAGWCGIYPPEVYEKEYEILCDLWHQGIEILHGAEKDIAPESEEVFRELLRIAETAYCHFRTTGLHAAFVRLRDAGKKELLPEIIREEAALAEKMFLLAAEDSRLGFEASNHYYYTRQTLLEKIINCDYLLKQFHY